MAAKKAPPKKAKAKTSAKKTGRDFRGMKNGVKDSGPGVPPAMSPIRKAMVPQQAPPMPMNGSGNC